MSPEHERGERSQEREPVLYYQAARFPSERSAVRTYERLQELVRTTPRVDLSVYRLLLDRVSYVAVLGVPPPEDVARRIARLLARGEPVRLPAEVRVALAERRRQQTRAGTWVERHHAPGERIPVPPVPQATSAGEPNPPIPLPEELAAFLRQQPDYVCLMQPTSAGTAFVLKVPGAELGTLRGRMPIGLTHELYVHPAAPVIRTVLSLFDRPEQPLRVETFTNVTDADQRQDFAALADQEELLLLLYDEHLRHRLSKRVPYPERDQIPELLDRALAIAAQIPAERRDFDAAKAAVMERTRL